MVRLRYLACLTRSSLSPLWSKRRCVSISKSGISSCGVAEWRDETWERGRVERIGGVRVRSSEGGNERR